MFIRERVKQNTGYKKRYIYHYLMESYRNADGKPRQRNLLSLGKLSLEKRHWKTLANRIEEIILNQDRLIECSPEIERHAQQYAALLIQKRSAVKPAAGSSAPAADYEEIDINSLEPTQVRTIGAEHAAWAMVQRLDLSGILEDCGISGRDNLTACIATAARMVHPASELGTHQWLQALSGLCELAGSSIEEISLSRLYRVSDQVYRHHKAIEAGLRVSEQQLFGCSDKIYLYDLTNTYFESPIGSSRIKRYGRSKEKRSDCPLLTLGVVYNTSGFPLSSRVFSGNVREHTTLAHMIQVLTEQSGSPAEDSRPTIVMDAGIATEDNLTMLRESGYHYLCVARNKPLRPDEIDLDNLITLRHSKDNLVEAQLHTGSTEQVLFCRSRRRGLKEQSIKTRFVKRFEEELTKIRNSLFTKHGTKRISKVYERIGRAREKNARVAHCYAIEVETEGDRAVDMTWEQKDPQQLDDRFAGTYFLRTSRRDLSAEELWETYILLTDAEDGFRSLKSELGLRPNFHQTDRRMAGHTFISVLAFHCVAALQWYLHKQDIYMRWSSIREFLSSQVRSTQRMRTRDNRTIYVRSSSEPEEFHRIIATALDIPAKPLGRTTRKT
jgi:transposase